MTVKICAQRRYELFKNVPVKEFCKHSNSFSGCVHFVLSLCVVMCMCCFSGVSRRRVQSPRSIRSSRRHRRVSRLCDSSAAWWMGPYHQNWTAKERSVAGRRLKPTDSCYLFIQVVRPRWTICLACSFVSWLYFC